MLASIRRGFPAGQSFVFEFPTEQDARGFFACEGSAALKTLERWGCEMAIARVSGQQDISIPIATLRLMSEFKPLVQLFFADTSLPPSVLRRAVVRMDEGEGRWGIVRMRDERQVVMSSGMAGVLLAGVGIESTTNWRRPEFWNPDQLREFNSQWRRTLDEAGDRIMDYRYQIRKPGSRDPWEWYRSSYRLMRGEDGGLYQMCEFLSRG
jgi:hypothetical protein